MSIRQGQTIIAKTGLMGGSSSYKGEYSDTTVYNTGDYVNAPNNNSVFFMCTQDNVVGKSLGNSYWVRLDNDGLVNFHEENEDSSYYLGLIPGHVSGTNHGGVMRFSPNAPKVNASTGEIVGYAKTENLPTKVSELENDSNFISNTATGENSITINGVATTYKHAINIGESSRASDYSTAIGALAGAGGNGSTAIGRKTRALKNNSIAIGISAESNAAGAIALGAQAKNNEEKTFKVALTDANDSIPATDESTGLYTLLTSDGKIPNERLNLTDYALKSELPIVPTNVSAFTNDSGYLTAHQDISGKADKSDTYTKTEVDAKVSSVYRFKGSVANYDALPTSGLVVGDVYNIESNGSNYAWDGNDWDKLSETIDLTPYLTKNEASTTYATINDVNGEIATLEGSIGNKADKTAIPTKTSQLTNDSGYLTSHQDISGKANTSLSNINDAGKSVIDNRIASIIDSELPTIVYWS